MVILTKELQFDVFKIDDIINLTFQLKDFLGNLYE